MISFRRADLLNEYESKQFNCRLELVFPTTENGVNQSDSDEQYMGILNLEIDSPTTLNEHLAIWNKVNEVLAPYKGTIDSDSEADLRKFYSNSNQNLHEFVDVSTCDFQERIQRISSSPVTENFYAYNNDEALDRVTISFTIKI